MLLKSLDEEKRAKDAIAATKEHKRNMIVIEEDKEICHAENLSRLEKEKIRVNDYEIAMQETALSKSRQIRHLDKQFDYEQQVLQANLKAKIEADMQRLDQDRLQEQHLRNRQLQHDDHERKVDWLKQQDLVAAQQHERNMQVLQAKIALQRLQQSGQRGNYEEDSS